MCACGRTKTQAVTSVNAAQEQLARQAAERALYEQGLTELLTGAEQLTKSAANAIGNSRS